MMSIQITATEGPLRYSLTCMNDLEGIAQLEWRAENATLLSRLPIRILQADDSSLTGIVSPSFAGEEHSKAFLESASWCTLRFADDSAVGVSVEWSGSALRLRLSSRQMTTAEKP